MEFQEVIRKRKMVRSFEDALRNKDRSLRTVQGIIVSLGAILADAQERGLVMQNVAHGLRARRRQDARAGSTSRNGRCASTPRSAASSCS